MTEGRQNLQDLNGNFTQKDLVSKEECKEQGGQTRNMISMCFKKEKMRKIEEIDVRNFKYK